MSKGFGSSVTKTMRGLVCLLVLLAFCASPVLAAAAGHAGAREEAVAEAAAQDKGEENKELLGWGVFALAAGEVAGLIGTGVSHIRREHAAERRAARAAAAGPKPVRPAVEDWSLLHPGNYLQRSA